MLPLRNGQLRVILLTHLVSELAQADKAELKSAGIEPDAVERLRALSLPEIQRLAALREPMIGLAVDGTALKTGLRNLAILKQTQFLEDYFIRHGASPAMMTALFKMPYKTTLSRRHAAGMARTRGRPFVIPTQARDCIHKSWMDLAHLDMRLRYYRLHQAFPGVSLHALHRVVTEFDGE